LEVTVTAYCTVTMVREMVSTELSDTAIEGIIDEVDASIAWDYDLSGVPALVIQRASRLKTAYTILLRDPQSFKLGDYAQDRGKTLELLKAEMKEALDKLSQGGAIKAFNEPISDY
jgi:hypothetical protein